MVCVPECFQRLRPYLVVRSGVHAKHTNKHDMAGNPPSLGIKYLNSGFWSDLIQFDVEEASDRLVLRGIDEGAVAPTSHNAIGYGRMSRTTSRMPFAGERIASRRGAAIAS